MTRGVLLVACCMVLVACRGASRADGIHWVNAEVAAAMHAWDATMAVPREPLALADGTEINNCRDYLAFETAARADESVQDQPASSDYLICETLDALHSAGPATEGVLPVDAGRALFKRLDLRTVPSSLGPRVDEHHRTLETLIGADAQVSEYAVTLDDTDWFLRIELVAVADVNHNGAGDWLLWLADEAKEGSYRAHRLVLVLDAANEAGLLRGFTPAELASFSKRP